MTPADKPEPVACPECGHLAGEESDLLTIAYMSGVYDERKARENGLRPTSDLAERIEGLVEEWSEDRLQDELRLLYNHVEDDSRQFTRWNMHVAITHGISLAANALKEVNSHD